MTNLKTRENILIVTGAAGKIGRALRAQWGSEVCGQTAYWSARRLDQGIDFAWDIGRESPPPLPNGAIFLHLAGQTGANFSELAENRHAAQALGFAAQASGARHVFFMSSAAVYRPEPTMINETQVPDPATDYGRAKLDSENALRDPSLSFGLTILRLGNLAGADALLSAALQGPVVLDPVEGQTGGPVRSYIGPRALGAALAALIALAAKAQPLPAILNLAQDPALPMAALLTALGTDWTFGPPRLAAIARVALSVDRLKGCVDVPAASAESVVADLNSMRALWP